MRLLARLFRALAFIGAMAVAVPYLLVTLLLALLLGGAITLIIVGLSREWLFGVPGLTWPHGPLDALWSLVLYPAGLAATLYAWAERTGVANHFRRTGDTHGSARFASPAETRALTRDAPGALLVGRDLRSGRLLRYDGPAHLLTLAPTRAGKGVGAVLPNLLTANRSVLVIDPKGENARVAHHARERFGPVHVLDPFGATGLPAAAYNPMDFLRPDDPDLGEDATALAEALVVEAAGPGGSGDAHWNEEARALLTGLILLVACHEEGERRTLATVREYLTLPPDRWAALLVVMADSTAAHGLVARAANRHRGKAEREAASVLSTAQRHTHFLDSPRIAAAMARSDFRFAELRRHTASVFLVLPPNRLDAHGRWLRLLVAQALGDVARAAERPQDVREGSSATPHAPDPLPALQGASQRLHGASPRPGAAPVLFLLDEFAALGRLHAVERAMGLMAGYGLQLWPILQDLSQLRGLYGDRAGTFVANAGVVQAFGVNDLDTAQWLSRTLGRATIDVASTSRRDDGEGSTSLSATGRDLLTPDEVLRLPPELQILRLQGRPPVLARKLRHYADPEFQGLLAPEEDRATA